MIKRLTGQLFFFIVTLSILPPIHADTITCYFENYAGEQVKCSRQPFTTNYPYLIEDKGTHYKITNDADVCKLPKKLWIDYSFTPNKISISLTIDSLVSLPAVVKQHNNSVYYLEITNMSAMARKCGKMFWDEHLDIVDNGTFTGEFDEFGNEIKNYSHLPSGNAEFKVINNQLRLYVYKQWLTQTAQFPITINMDSWILNSTEGWDGTFNDFRTTLDENQSIKLNDNHSLSTFQNAISYYPLDQNINDDGFNNTHALDFNLSSGNDGEFGTVSGPDDAIGRTNRSRDFIHTQEDLIDLPNAFSKLSSGALSAWFRIEANLADPATIFMFTDSGDGSSYAAVTTFDEYPEIRVKEGATWKVHARSTNQLSFNIWYHILAQQNGSGYQIFIDGIEQPLSVLQGALNDTSWISAVADIDKSTIGAWVKTAGEFWEFNGKIDDIMITSEVFTQSDVLELFNGSYYTSGNFTSTKRDWGINGTANISFSGSLPSGTSVNIYQNYSINDINWDVELVQANAQLNTNYTPANKVRYNHYILELNTSTSATPHITEIEIYEGVADPIPIIITNQTPANGSNFNQSGNTVNVPFSATCTDGLIANCSNGTLIIWNSTDDQIIFTVVHDVTSINLVHGASYVGDSLNQDDGIYGIATETDVGTTDCLTVEYNFSNVPTYHNHTVIWDGKYFPAGAGHVISFYWRNIVTNGLEFLWNITKSNRDQNFESGIIDANLSVDASGNFSVWQIHSSGANCISSHQIQNDLLQLSATDDTIDFTNGVANFTVPLMACESPYKFIFTARDTAGNEVAFSGGNYTFTVTAIGPIFNIINPLNATYTLQNVVPITLDINEPEIDSVWYSLTGAANVTIIECDTCSFWPNDSISDIRNGEHELIVYVNLTSGGEENDTVFFEVNFMGINETDIAAAVWAHNSTERTTNNFFDKILGGDLLANEQIFLFVLVTICIYLGMHTKGRAGIPFFLCAGLLFAVWGLYIRNQLPFAVFGSDVGQTDIGLFNLAAMWTMFVLSVIMFIYPLWGEVQRRRNL